VSVNAQWFTLGGAALGMLGLFAAAYVRDRNNPMRQVVAAAVQNTTSMSRQLQHAEHQCRHHEVCADLWRTQLREHGIEPYPEPPMTAVLVSD